MELRYYVKNKPDSRTIIVASPHVWEQKEKGEAQRWPERRRESLRVWTGGQVDKGGRRP